MFRIHESTENTSVSPLLEKDLDLIREQTNEWSRTFGPGKVALWMFDASFHQLYESEGYEFASNLLTQTRHALRRSEKSRGATYPMRCIGDRQPDQWRERSPQTLRKIGAKARQAKLLVKEDRIRIEERITRGAAL